MPMTALADLAHDLTMEVLTIRPGGPSLRYLGRCSCSKFVFTGPEGVIRDMHAIHLVHPETSLKGSASR
jgi:hypothetical protein